MSCWFSEADGSRSDLPDRPHPSETAKRTCRGVQTQLSHRHGLSNRKPADFCGLSRGRSNCGAKYACPIVGFSRHIWTSCCLNVVPRMILCSGRMARKPAFRAESVTSGDVGHVARWPNAVQPGWPVEQHQRRSSPLAYLPLQSNDVVPKSKSVLQVSDLALYFWSQCGSWVKSRTW